ncbi:MAG: NUDIX hydrolase [Pseudomonadota bacterium]
MTERFRQPDGRVHAVIVACQRVDGRWLLIRRSQHVRAPGKVGFPGGALEAGETQADAVIREMREELGADVRPMAGVWRFDFPEHPMTLFGWRAELVSAALTPAPAEVAETLWLSAEEALSHPDGTAQLPDFMTALLSADGAQSRV